MRIQGAVIREQGPLSLSSSSNRMSLKVDPRRHKRYPASSHLLGLPVILMAQDGRGRPTYYGRKDIARFLSAVLLEAIPWREYTIS